MSADPRNLRRPQVVTPSADRLDLPLECRRADEAKAHLEVTTGIPATLQRLYRDGRELEPSESIEGDDLDLVLVLGSAYTVSRRELSAATDTFPGEPLHPPRSEAARRDPQALSRGVRIHRPGDLGTSERFETAAVQSRELRGAWTETRHRRLTVLRAIAARLEGRSLVTSVFNEGFVPLLRNWAASCERHGVDPRSRTLLFPTDDGANAAAVELGFATFFGADCMRGVPRESAASYGDPDFRQAVMFKPAIVADLLEIGRDVLFQDMDVVWLTDPLAELDRLAAHDALDALFMNDGPNGRFGPRHYNSGFFFVRNNRMTRALWRSMMRRWPAVHMLRSDQALLNRAVPVFESRGLRTAPLEDLRFVNGHVFVAHERRGLPMPPDPVVVHMSWCGNLTEKIAKMKLLGYWYLDEAAP